MLITHVTRDFFKILACHEIWTPVFDLRTHTLTDCATVAPDIYNAYSFIYSKETYLLN